MWCKRGSTPGVEISEQPEEPDVLDGGDALQPSVSIAELVFRHAQLVVDDRATDGQLESHVEFSHSLTTKGTKFECNFSPIWSLMCQRTSSNAQLRGKLCSVYSRLSVL